MNHDNDEAINTDQYEVKAPNGQSSALYEVEALSRYVKSCVPASSGRTIPPLAEWHPQNVTDMDLVIKANGEWWHEGDKVTRKSLVSLFATILCKEEDNGVVEYFLKTPVQKIRIQVEDAPLLINDVGIVHEANHSWLEFMTTTGDVVRLDDEHRITLRAYTPSSASGAKHRPSASEPQVRPYMPVRNGLTALINRNTFYHLVEIGELSERHNQVFLTLKSGGRSYELSMPADLSVC